ncbi:MAG: chemotaxis protein [Planctomycetia bacterium]|nr:chemotaxis protein [Planctomycetia bacterium]
MTRPTDRAAAVHADAVAIGRIGVATQGMLRTFVGSCVAVALLDRRRGLAALAHVMLPASHGAATPPGKFADTAVPEMLRLLAERAGEAPACTAKLVGGARMFAFGTGTPIGEQNVAALEHALAVARIPVIARDCGGDCGRRVSVDVATGAVTVETVGHGTRTL